MSIFTSWKYPKGVWQTKDDTNDITWNRLDASYLVPNTQYDIYAVGRVIVPNVQVRIASLITSGYYFNLPSNAIILAVEAKITRKSSLLIGVDMHWKWNDLYNDLDNTHQYPPKDNYGNLVVIRSGIKVPFGVDNTIYLRHENWGNYFIENNKIISELTPEFLSPWNFQFYIKMGLNSWDGIMDVNSSIHIKDVALRVEYVLPNLIDDETHSLIELGTI